MRLERFFLDRRPAQQANSGMDATCLSQQHWEAGSPRDKGLSPQPVAYSYQVISYVAVFRDKCGITFPE